MLPSADKLYGDADLIFQQDLAPAHTAKGTKSWFNDHGDHADDLKAAIKAFITPEQCHGLIAFMPRRIDAVINTKGGPTKYWMHRNEHTFQKPDISV